MSENVSEFQWTKQREKAAKLVADDKLSDKNIAAEVGITERTLERWKSDSAFDARVNEIIERYRQAILTKGIADRTRRVEALHDRWTRMQGVITARAEAMVDEAPGSETGLLVHQVKGIGKGNDFQVIDEYAVDTGLLRELREHERQAAQELGQWVERKDVTGILEVKGYQGINPDSDV